MAQILFITWDGGGNVPPAVGIAAELKARGHSVRFLGHAGNRTAVETAGLPFRAYEHARPFSSTDQLSPERMVEMFNDAGIPEDMLADADASGADVVVIDCMLLAAMATARRSGLPYVPLEHLYDTFYREGFLAAPFGEVAQERGYAPFDTLESAPLRIVASLRELDPAASLPVPPNVFYSGPIVLAPPIRDLAALPPTVLVSLSTFNFPGQDAAMQTVLDAVDGLAARVIVTTGPVIEASALRAPPGVEMHTYVDHDALMPEVTMLFGHGGHATTMRALAHDIPLAVMPAFPMADQVMVGQSVENAGAGRMVPSEATVGQIRGAIDDLLADGPHRSAAARLGKAIRESRGAASAADRIMALL